MRSIIVRDLRIKEKFFIDDYYLNGYARILKPTATAVYLSLCRHADKEQNCFPSLNLIAKEHSINEKTVRRAIQKLKKHTIIHYEQTRNKEGRWLHNTYFLVDKSQWMKEPVGQNIRTAEMTSGQAQPVHQESPTKDTHSIKDTHTYSSKKKPFYEGHPLVKIGGQWMVWFGHNDLKEFAGSEKDIVYK